ncbi:hypothetical protein B0O80DRAFT_495033 [Mortierella sp. GBAus27b]|nr:hypothetical protein B0O80DRAFT_495033 [Mortierella sp. GBAus27b]
MDKTGNLSSASRIYFSDHRRQQAGTPNVPTEQVLAHAQHVQHSMDNFSWLPSGPGPPLQGYYDLNLTAVRSQTQVDLMDSENHSRIGFSRLDNIHYDPMRDYTDFMIQQPRQTLRKGLFNQAITHRERKTLCGDHGQCVCLKQQGLVQLYDQRRKPVNPQYLWTDLWP